MHGTGEGPAHELRFGDFRVLEPLASGGMAVVYRAVHVERGQEVALKVSRGPSEHAIESIRREQHALSRLQHPGVVRIVGHGSERGVPWYAMELLRGTTLRRSWGPPSTLGRTLTIIRRLCQTLEFLHGEGIVHRDLKPDNIMLQPGDLPIVVDFGIFHRFAGAEGRERLEVDAVVSGTLDYVAPEQLRGLQPDARTDLFAVGCILFEAVCGSPPFRTSEPGGAPRQRRRPAPPRPSTLEPSLPPALDDLILSLLAEEPADRPGHADDVGRILEELGAEPSPALTEPKPRAYLYRPPFAGHADLLAALRDELERAAEGNGRMVLLTGPSGAGKTRVTMEIGREARRLGMRVVTGECDPTSSEDAQGALAASGPLGAFRPLLRLIADRCRGEGPTTTRRLLGANVRVLEEIEPALTSVPGRDAFPTPAALSPLDAAERAQRAVVEALSAWAAITPTLLAIDDLQWADDLTVGTLTMLGREPPDRRFYFLLLTRRSEVPSSALDVLAGTRNVVTMPLLPLAEAEVGRIAAGMTAMSSLPPSLAAFLTTQCGGSPLFVSEYLKAAVVEGILVRRAGRWGLAASRGEFSPVAAEDGFAALSRLGSVETLIARRLEGLDPDAQRFVQSGAVWGREWSEVDAGAVAGLDDDHAMDAAEALLLRQILMETDDGHLRFVHDRLRETTYAGIPAPERKRLHRGVAEALEASGKDESSDAASCRSLAQHWHVAEDLVKAFRYGESAGKKALDAGAFHEAARDLEAALALAKAPSSPITLSPAERGRITRALADALYAAGDVSRMVAHTVDGVDALGVLRVPKTERQWALAALKSVLADVAAKVLPRGWTQLRQSREAVTDTGYLLSRLSQPYLYGDKPLSFLGTNVAARHYAEQANDSETIAWVSGVLGVALTPMRLTSLAGRLVARAREHAEHTPSLEVQLYQTQIEAYFWSLQASWTRAKELIDSAIERSRAAGAPFRTEQLLIISCIIHNDCNDLARAVSDARVLETSARASSHELSEAFGAMMLGLALTNMGHVDEATRALTTGVRLLDKPHLAVQRANCHAALAACRLARGDLPGALNQFELAAALVPKPAPANIVARPQFRFGAWVRLAAWEDAAARGLPTAALEQRALAAVARTRRHAFHLRSSTPVAERQWAEVLRLRGRPAQAARALRASLASAEALKLPLEQAWARLDLARVDRARAPEHRAAARALFAGLECPAWVELAEGERDSALRTWTKDSHD